MNYLETFNDIKKEFDEETALLATICIAINLATPPEEEDIFVDGLYENKLLEKFDDFLWEYSEERKKLVLSIWRAEHSYSISKSLAGLGGCTLKTYKEIIERENK